MRWSFTIGSFRGTSVRIHLTLLLFLAWIGFTAWRRGGPAAATESVLFISAIFACVVLHEFGHILTARRFGIISPEVTLLPIGGVADMNRMPDKPWQELLIALAGPMVNIIIAVTLIVAVGAFDLAGAVHIDDPAESLAGRLAVTNIFLAVFNLIPAFPMDGGRILRALLTRRKGRLEATRIAAKLGKICALLFGLVGLFGLPGVVPSNLMLVIIAVFIYISAASEYRQVLMQEMSHRPPPIFQWFWSNMRPRRPAPPPSEPLDNNVTVSPPPWQRRGSTRTDLKPDDEP